MDETQVPFATIQEFLDQLDTQVAMQRLQLVLTKIQYLIPEALEGLLPGEHDILVTTYRLEAVSPLRRTTPPRFRERSGVTASTIATYRGKLGPFFSWLVARGRIAANPFATMPYPPVQYERREYLSKTDVERIFAALVLSVPSRTRFQRTRDIALFATLLYVGLRRGELLGLRLTDVNLERFEMLIRAATSKSRASRVVPINAALAQALEDYLDERRALPLSTPQLFVVSAGTPLTTHGLKHLTERIAARSGVRFHVHQFRHTFAVNVLHSSGDVAKLKQLLGHRDIRMTSGYLRSLPTAAMRSNVESLRLDTLL